MPGGGEVDAIKGGSILSKLGNAGLTGARQAAIQAAAQPITGDTDNYLSSKLALVGVGGAGGAAGGTVLSGLGSAASKVLPNAAALDRMDAMQRLGMNPNLIEATGSAPVQQLGKISANLVGGGAINRAVDENAGRLAGTVGDVASSVAQPLNRPQLGDFLQGAGQRALDNFNSVSSRLYDRASNLAPDWIKVSPLNTQDVLNSVKNAFQNNPELGKVLQNSQFSNLADALERSGTGGQPASLSMDEARALRTQIGQMRDQLNIAGSPGQGDIAQAYKAINDDIRSSLQTAGTIDPNAQKAANAYQRADNYYKAGSAQMTNIVKPLIASKTDSTAANILDKFMKGDVNGIRQLRSRMSPDDWNTVTSSVFSNLGKPNPGQAIAGDPAVSLNKWLTDYNNLKANPDAFKAAFQGPQYDKIRSTMDDIATVANNARQGQRYFNPTGSGYTAGNIAAYAGLAHLNPVAWSGLGLNMLTSHALSSTRVANALSAAVRNPLPRQGAAQVRALMARAIGKYAGQQPAMGSQ
jgi:hypothetical protein